MKININLGGRPEQRRRVRGWLAGLQQKSHALLTRISRLGRKQRLIYGGWEVNPHK